MAPETQSQVGRVVGLWRYPVKSMGAEPLTEADVAWHGIAGDRRWAFVRAGMERSGFPWLTLRQRVEMHRYQPSFVDPTVPDTSATVVSTPSGAELDVTDPALREELGHRDATVIRQDRGAFDAFPLSLITTQTIAQLGEWVGDELNPLRFRPNLLVDAAGSAPFVEDTWVGSVLKIGGIEMRVDKRDGRCVVTTIDPETGEKNPAVLRSIARERDGCLGVYGSVVEPGRVAVGDPVILTRAD